MRARQGAMERGKNVGLVYVTGTPIFGFPPEPISDVALRIADVYCASLVMTLQTLPSWELFHPCSKQQCARGRADDVRVAWVWAGAGG